MAVTPDEIRSEPKPTPSPGQSGRPSSASFRGRHRAASHRAAHDDAHTDAHLAAAETSASEHSPGHASDHPLVPHGIEPLIATPANLARLIGMLRDAGSFAYDSEFIGESSYHPQLCLIQVATVAKVWLIDPMAVGDLRAFWELLADPSVEKLVHAGEQDLEPVVRHLDRPAQNVLDTQVAAGFVAMAYPVSLSKLVLETMGVKLGKGLTFTDWSQRPLSNVQLRYAADDVRYLPAIVDQLKGKLRTLRYEKWARLESEAMGDPVRFRFDPDTDFMRVRGAGGLPPQNLAVLRELTIWREQGAQSADAPPRAFLKDEILIAMARAPIKRAEQLSRVRGLPRPVEIEHAPAILAATAAGLAASTHSIPARPLEPSPSQRFAAEALWAAVQAIAAGRSIDPNLLTSRQEICDLHRHLWAGTDPTGLRVLRGWRREAIGEEILALAAGKAAYQLRWDDGLRVAPAAVGSALS